MPKLLCLLLFFCPIGLTAQVTLFAEDFNNCQLSPGWQVKTTGNPNPVWYVGDSLLNDDNQGQSMNGSCFLMIDDDATGDQSPAYRIDFISPAFDASQFPTLELSLDVHYRDWYDAQESFTVLVTDGVTERTVSRFERSRATGDSLFQFVTLKYDLALLTQSPNARLILRYDDGGGFCWWAAVDNILVRGSGSGQNLVAEAFNDCIRPDGWETQVVTGQDDWRFGLIDTFSDAYYGGTSMDGTCFAYFDDDVLGSSAPFSTVRLYTPWFDGTVFGRFDLNFDVVLRYYKEKIAVFVQDASGAESLVRESAGDVGGPNFPDYVHATLDLSPYRAKQMRVVFEYSDGNDFGWWAGLDNIKITGDGAANDLCNQAIPLFTGAACKTGDNLTAILEGPIATCTPQRTVGGVWYKWQADFSGVAKLSSHAQFNDLVNVYTGGCANLQTVYCNNRDEHGFQGESSYFPVQSGTPYWLRISGQEGGFGVSRGQLCVEMEQAADFPAIPVHDDCANALPLTLDAPCLTGNNLNATMSTTLPPLNELARADVWYKFTAPPLSPVPGEQFEIQSHATFSDIITVYQGACNLLEAVAGNHKGGVLELPSLTPGKTYYVQIAGNFATVEGQLCPQFLKKIAGAPVNDQCLSALNVPIDGSCVAASNLNAAFSGYTPPCVVSADRDIWFKFTAPASGSIRFNTGAAFEHVAAIWEGDCNQLRPLFCLENPLRCQGYTPVGNLIGGQTYFLQIAAWSAAAGPGHGTVCVKILDGPTPPDFQPLTLTVQEHCVAPATAALWINALGGRPPFDFQGSQNGQILASGDRYLVVVTDAMGCEVSLVGVVDECTQGCSVAATLTSQHPSCFDLPNGSLTVNVTDGAAPFQYKWSNNASTPTLSDLPAGAYTVTITDAAQCETTASATLVAPFPLVVVPASLSHPNPGQSNGHILVDVSGGLGPYANNWYRNGLLFAQGVEDLSNVPAGEYRLEVVDAKGCMASFLFTLVETVGTQAPGEAIFAEVFPNPAKNKATLAIALPQTQPLYLTIFDGAGQALRSWTVDRVSEQNIPLDLHLLPGGVYQLRILAGTAALLRKLVVVGQ